MPLARYLRHSRIMAVLSSPFIYLCFLAFLVLDISISMSQAVCFPIYEDAPAYREGVETVRRNFVDLNG
jgi:hypothetical protein